ncbi:thiamine phosphate synthase [Hypericibacter sp.]|uniref:thiamine phosphate synthase n=1 Tax=Hypericibacter sp. TaxID=2705401 RepID=UPI003D6CA22A
MKRPFDPSLYLILDLALVGPGPVDRLVTSAMAGGVTLVQLRGKAVPTRELCELGTRIKTLLAPHRVPLIVNDDVAAALAIEADGVHLGQDDLPPAAARRILGEDAVIGLSIGSPAEAVGVDGAILDYVSIGPIHRTSTKSDAGPAIGIEGFDRVRRLFPDLPAVAIGGITPDNAADIIRAGAAGLAVASALCYAVEPALAARAFRSRIAIAARPRVS